MRLAMSSFSIQAFYKFIPLSSCQTLQQQLLEVCKKEGVMGTILLAEEGINATLAGDFESLNEVVRFMQEETPIGTFPVKHSEAATQPFSKLKVRIKKEIVTLGMPEINPYEKNGTYVDWKEWNQLLADPETVVLDVRNDYEIELGTFPGSVNPDTLTFKQFPQFVKDTLDPNKNKKVAMCCTGGIRCEKASAYMLEQGFEQVFHLEGGILKYLETVEPQENKWQGECFVFDDRVTITETLAEGNFAICRQCFEARPCQKENADKEFICEECLIEL
jgi:UPF0176 protein